MPYATDYNSTRPISHAGWVATLKPVGGRIGPDVELWCQHGCVEETVSSFERLFGYRMVDINYAERMQ